MSKSISEIRGVDSRDLQMQLAELRKEKFQLRFRGATEQVARTSRHREIRRAIARILTVLGERDTAAAKNGARS